MDYDIKRTLVGQTSRSAAGLPTRRLRDVDVPRRTGVLPHEDGTHNKKGGG